jgi:hypothetical protein
VVADHGRGLVSNIMRGTICVVESDHIIRLYVVTLLEEEGFMLLILTARIAPLFILADTLRA